MIIVDTSQCRLPVEKSEANGQEKGRQVDSALRSQLPDLDEREDSSVLLISLGPR